MRASEFRELIKETFLYLLEEDEEFQNEVSDKLQRLGVLSESTGKNPTNLDLFDNLKLLAEGKISQMSISGKRIKSPKLKGSRSKKWAMKAYEKYGGKWLGEGEVAPSDINHDTERASNTLEFMNEAFGGNSNEGVNDGSSILSAGSSNNSQILKEAIDGIPTMMKAGIAFDTLEEGVSESVDMTEILMDTARTTLQTQPMSHNSNMMTPPDAASMVVAEKTPDQLFGTEMANSTWAKLAFNGE